MISTEKMACAREPFTLDWSDFYARHGIDQAVKLITSSVWTISDGVKGPEFTTTPQTTLTIEGGVPGIPIIAKNVIEINGGEYRDCRELYIEVF